MLATNTVTFCVCVILDFVRFWKLLPEVGGFQKGSLTDTFFRNVSQTKVVFACLVSRLIVTQARQGSDCS